MSNQTHPNTGEIVKPVNPRDPVLRSDYVNKWYFIDTAPKIYGGDRPYRFLVACWIPRESKYTVHEARWNQVQKEFTSLNGFIIFDSAKFWQPMPETIFLPEMTAQPQPTGDDCE